MLRAAKPLRRRKPASLCVMEAGATNSADTLNPASAYLQQLAEHELVDMGIVALKQKAKARGSRGYASKQRAPRQKGVCGLHGCKITKPKRPQLRCCACNNGRGAYYHMECFFKVHRCCKE